jgi:hypothetical protein
MKAEDPGNSARNRLLSALESAGKKIKQIRADRNMEYHALYGHLRAYILARFLLGREEAGEAEGLAELAEMSIAKTMSIRREELPGVDISGSCTGSSSVVTKKVLLLISLEKELDIDFQPEESARITTVSELAESVHKKLKRMLDIAVIRKVMD